MPFHKSVQEIATSRRLTEGERASIAEAVETLQSRLADLPGYFAVEVALLPNEEARRLSSASRDSRVSPEILAQGHQEHPQNLR